MPEARPRLRNNRGAAFLVRGQPGDYARARAEFRQAYALGRRPEAVLRPCALAWRLEGKPDRALRVAEELLALLPKREDPSGQLHVNSAQALLDLGRAAEACAEARRAVAISPHEALAHVVLGRALATEAELEAAREAAREAIRLRPYEPLGWASLARLELAEGALGPAQAASEQALACVRRVTVRWPFEALLWPTRAELETLREEIKAALHER